MLDAGQVQILGPNGQPVAQDTAHRGASLSARELSSWLPSLGSADTDLLGELYFARYEFRI